MEEKRRNPDELLALIHKEEVQEKNEARGHLKIFFGYAAGVGKTYAMLEAAHAAQRADIDVVVGYVEPHARPETTALLEGLEILPTLDIEYNGITLHEVDIDAAIKRKPDLILVDEFAHSNAEGSRHTKRYQDVEELLNAGIDVFTTLNVQHIESLNDLVASITGVMVRERIPDSVFDNAHQVELVDIEPQDLINRLNSGNVYREAQAKRAIENFFTVENLTGLREIALRRCADRVNIRNETARLKSNATYHTDEHILVCLSSSPANPKIIRTAARMASAFKGGFTALFVETPDFVAQTEEDKLRLRSNMHLAEQLGAKIEIVYGEDVPFQIAEFARLSGVSKVVIGRSSATRKHLFGKPTLTDQLIAHAPNLDVHIIPDASADAANYKPRKAGRHIVFSFKDILKCIAVLLISSLIGSAFDEVGFAEANIIVVYVLGVLVTAIVTSHQIYSLISSVVSVLAFNYLFTEPRYSLEVYDQGYPTTFVIMFIVAFLTGSLAIRLKNLAKQSSRSAFRTKLLFDTNQLLQQAKNIDEIVTYTSEQLTKLLGRNIVFYLAQNKMLAEPQVFNARFMEEVPYTTCDHEKAVAAWVYKNNKHAGATTETLTSSKCLYLPVQVNGVVYGVVGIVIADGQPLAPFENSILLSILGECALALENDKNAREKEEAAVFAKNEQLRTNLLRAVARDLRAPLDAISSNATRLISDKDELTRSDRENIYHNIDDDSTWLIGMVNDLLTVVQIEEGRLNLNIVDTNVYDTVAESLRHINKKSVEHNIRIETSDSSLMAKMDSKFITQVIINIVDNAIQYTPKGSNIVVKTWLHGTKAVISVQDDGSGVPDDIKEKVFEMFYTKANEYAENARGSGLGLSICKSIIDAHGGVITVTDNEPHGAVFTFMLPAAGVEE